MVQIMDTSRIETTHAFSLPTDTCQCSHHIGWNLIYARRRRNKHSALEYLALCRFNTKDYRGSYQVRYGGVVDAEACFGPGSGATRTAGEEGEFRNGEVLHMERVRQESL
jgi:hypothetical protein